MSPTWKTIPKSLAVAAFLALVPAVSQAICGDLNNDGARNTTDAIILSQCIANAGVCPAVSPGPLCGTGSLAACGDIFGDGDVSFPVGQNADLAVLLQSLAGLSTLYDICDGPKPSKVIACGGGTVDIGTGTISTGQTWPKTCKVRLTGTVLVAPSSNPADPTTVLRIEKGSVVTGDHTASDAATLIFLPGTHADIQGTQSEPVIFTSDRAPGSKLPGDWGGIMFNGKSNVNGPDCKFNSEGVPEPFGGCVANDNSGIVTFFRSEFGGKLFTPDNELNAFTMNGIGSQTQFNFIQGHAGKDDCIEWFGGTSNHNHLVSSACADDGLDSQLGYSGAVQYAVMFQNGQLTDANSRDDRCFEVDNSEFDNAAMPFNDPDYCNVTCIGAKAQMEFADNGGSDVGMMLRRGTHGQWANLLVTGFQDAGLELRDTSTTNSACVDANADGIPESLTGNLIVRNSVFWDNGGGGTEQAKDNDGTLDTTAGADTGACAAAGCKCDSEGFYDRLVASFNVVNTNGTSTVVPASATFDEYPPLNNALCTLAGVPWSCCTGLGTGDCDTNADCTAAGTPYTCCTAAGTGTCRAVPDVRYNTGTAGLPAAFACKTLNPLFDSVTYLGGVDPATATCNKTQCDWLSKPWIEFGVN